jgi:glycosyltransferase involved in cell wall biosynthesis
VTAVHQFLPGLLRRDAIGDEAWAIREALRGAGYDSEIFVGRSTGDGDRDARPLDTYAGDGRGLLIHHHPIGNEFVGALTRLPDRLVLRYHNITPARFYRADRAMAAAIERGHRQVRFLRDRTVGALIASQFNARDLRAAGYRDIVLVESVFSVPRLLTHPRPPRQPIGESPLILFVGRGSLNKRQDHVISAFECFVQHFAPAARLALVGNLYAESAWGERVSERIARSPVRDRITCPGPVSEAVLAEYYRNASLYLSMSEHEGFGVPLVESFAYGVPVLAYDVPGVAETMAGAGVRFRVKDWGQVAARMAALCFDDALRARVIAAQDARLRELDPAGARARLLAAVARWLSSRPPRAVRVRSAAAERIALLSPFHGGGEIAAHTAALAAALRRRGVQAFVLADQSGQKVGADPPYVERVPLDATAVASAALERRVDLLHVQTHFDRSPGIWRLGSIVSAMHSAGIPVVATLHGPVQRRRDCPPIDENGARVLAACERVYVHAERDLDELRQLGIETGRLAPWAAGAPTGEVGAATAAALGFAGERVVAYLGAARRGVGLRETIEAIYLLQRAMPALRLVAIAPSWPEQVDPEYLADCRARIERLGMSDRIAIVDDLLSDRATMTLAGACELMVVPARHVLGEPAMTLRLALAAGPPVIAAGTLVPDGAADAVYALDGLDPGTIAGAVATLIDDEPRCRALTAAARRFVAAHQIERAVEFHLTEYRAIVAAAVAGAPPTRLALLPSRTARLPAIEGDQSSVPR